MSKNETNEPKKTILVIGGTGMLGAPVARQLARDGHHVRILSRDVEKAQELFGVGNSIAGSFEDNESRKNITCVEGNVDDISSLQRAMEGCTGIHINLHGGEIESRGTAQVVAAATSVASSMSLSSKTTIKRITLISGVTTCKENTWYSGTHHKLLAEEHLKNSGFEYTIFRCTMFIETLPKWKFVLKPSEISEEAKETRWHWLAAKDYAQMVSNSYSNPSSANKILFVYGLGPARSIKEAVDEFFIPICDSGREPTPILTLDEIRNHPQYSKDLTNGMVDKLTWLSKVEELGSPRETNDLLGGPTVSIEDWCRDYRTKNP